MKKYGQTYPMLMSVEHFKLLETKFNKSLMDVVNIGVPHRIHQVYLNKYGKKNLGEVDNGIKRIF